MTKLMHKLEEIEKAFGGAVFRRIKFLQLVSILVACLEVGGLSLLLPIINLVGSEQTFQIGTLSASATQAQIALLLAIVFITAMTLFGQAYLLRTASWLGGVLSHRAYLASISKSYSDLLREPASHWTNTVINESARAAHQVIVPATRLSGKLVFSILVFCVGVYTSPFLTLILIGFLVCFYGVIFNFVRPRLLASGKAITNSTEKRINLLNTSYQSFGEVKVFELGEKLSEEFHAQSSQFGEALGKTMIFGVAPRYLLEAIIGIAAGSTAIYLSISATADVDPQELVFLTILFLRLLPSVQETYQSVAAIRSHWSAMDACLKLINTADDFELSASKPVKAKHGLEKEYKERQLDVRIDEYVSDGIAILTDLEFSVRTGEFFTIVGPSGCGKSTAVKIIVGLLDNFSGSIRYASRDLDRSTFRWAYVGQQSTIIGNDFVYNIILNEEFDEERFSSIVSDCGLQAIYEKVHLASRAKDTELASVLSGGEKQRVAIARALYKDCDGYVFDEATSALDEKTEHRIIEAIKKHTSNAVCISVAHRKSVIEASDRLLKLGL